MVSCLLFLSAALWADGNDTYASASETFGMDPNAGRNSFFVLSIPSGGKYEGMASAHTAVALDWSFIEANPAAASFLTRTILSFSHVNWIADSGLETLAFTFRPDKNENIGLGFGMKFLHVPFTAYNPWGGREASNDSIVSSAGWYSETILTGSFSYKFLRSFYFGGVSVGASLKAGIRGVSASLAQGQNSVSLMGDFGIMTRFNFLKYYASRDMNCGAGLTLKNMGSEFIKDSDPLPSYISLGFSYQPIRPLTVALDVNYPFKLNGEKSGSLSFAMGINAEITSFLSTHGGIFIKEGKPRFTIGSDVKMKNMSLNINYSLDLTTRMDMLDRMSVTMKVDMDTVRHLIIRDNAQELYLKGLEAYAGGDVEEAIQFWENCLELDPNYKPAAEMLITARETRSIDMELRNNFNNMER